MEEIEKILIRGDNERALEICKELMKEPGTTEDARFWFIYGKTLWRLNRRQQAEAAYRRAVEINPDSPARLALEMSEDISAFFNPDLLNP